MAADASEQPEGGVLPVGTQVKDQVVQAWLRAVPEGHLYRVVHALSGEHALLQEYFPSDWARREGERVIAQPQRTMDYQVGLKRFLLRVRQLSRLQHPRLPTLLDAWPGQGTAYALLAEPPGRTLADVVQAAGGFLPLDRFWPWLHACMDFAEWLHAQGKVHGAWDPQGIWVLDDDRLVLPPPDVEGGAQPGSPWQALEQTALAPIGTQRGPWTDIFGIAALSAFMLTGQGPMSAARRGVGQRWTPPTKAGERAVSSVEPVPPALMAAIRVSLLPNPRQRPQGIPQLKAMMGLASPGAGHGGASSLMPRAVPPTDPESSGVDTVPDTLALEEADFLPEASDVAAPSPPAPSRPDPVEVPPEGGAEPGAGTRAARRPDAPEAEAPASAPAAADAHGHTAGQTAGDAPGEVAAGTTAGARDETPTEAPGAAGPSPLPAVVEPARKSPGKNGRRSRKGPDSRSGEASRPPALGEPSRPSIWSTRATPIDPASRSRPAPPPVPLAGLAAPTIATEGALVPAGHPRLPVPLGNDSVPTTRPGEGGSTGRQQSVRAAAIAAFASAALAAVLFIMEPPRPAELAGARGTGAAPTPQPITLAEKPVERQLDENPPAAGPAAGEGGVAGAGGTTSNGSGSGPGGAVGTAPAPGPAGIPGAAPGAIPAGGPAEASARAAAAPATGAAAVAAAPTAEAAASAAAVPSRRDAAPGGGSGPRDGSGSAGAATAAGRGNVAGPVLPRCSQALLEHSLGTDATTAGVAQHCR